MSPRGKQATTINNIRDFAICRRLNNLLALRAIGSKANRRLLDVQAISQNCQIGDETFEQITRPQTIEGQHASALKFGDPRVMALFQLLCIFCLIPAGFQNATLRQWMANLLGLDVGDYPLGKMTYDLRRLRLQEVIVRIPHTHRYQVTYEGLKVRLFFTKVHARVFRSGLAQIDDGVREGNNRPITAAINHLDKAIDQQIQVAKLIS